MMRTRQPLLAMKASARTVSATARQKFVFPKACRRGVSSIRCLPNSRLAPQCHGPRVVINEQVTRQLELEPAEVYVVEHVRFTYACAKCRSGEQMRFGQAAAADRKSPFGPSVLATIVVYKYARHMSLYREQEQLLGPLRTWLSRPLLYRLVRGTAQRYGRWPGGCWS